MKETQAQATQKLVEAVIEGIQAKKGRNIACLEIGKLENAVCDYFIICDASSTTQVDAVANSIEYTVKNMVGEYPLHVEGKRTARWVLVDYGDVVVHVFLEELRGFYNLEDLWADAKSRKIEE